MQYSSELLSEIRQKLSIVDVASQYTTLKKSGKNFKGLSPFVSEKSPSFFVSEEKGLAYCFSSHRGGDMFKFIMEVEQCTFPQAVAILAEKAGIDSREYAGFSSEWASVTSQLQTEEQQTIIQAYECAANVYHTQLWSDEAAPFREYLFSRGVTEYSIKQFRLGYAPAGGYFLVDQLQKYGFHLPDMWRCQLLHLVAGKIEEYRDAFRHRVMFPITDAKGDVIAFGGRVLPWHGEPKYLNTAEYDMFKKSQVLFWFSQAKDTIRKKKRVIVVEGYMDVLMLHQAWWTEAVAPLGTAFTADHARRIGRFEKEIVLAFDQDAAGQAAQKSTALLLLGLGYSVSVLHLWLKDPADILSQPDGVQQWNTLFDERKGYYDDRFAQFESILKQETSITIQSQKMQEFLTDLLVCQDDVLVEMFLRKIAHTAQISLETVLRTFSQLKKKQKTGFVRSATSSSKPVETPALGVEDTLLMFLFAAPWLIQHLPSDFCFQNPVKQDLLTRLASSPNDETVQSILHGETNLPDGVVQYARYCLLFFEKSFPDATSAWIEKEIPTILLLIEQKKKQKQAESLVQKIAEKEKDGIFDDEYVRFISELQNIMS